MKIIGTMRGYDVVQMTDMATMTIGRLGGGEVPSGIVEALDVPGFRLQVIDAIDDALWEKWVFIAAAGVVTCLFRAPVGAIMAAGGEPHVVAIVDELEAVAMGAGHPISARSRAVTLSMLTAEGSSFTSSLYRDVTAGLPNETEHILGSLAATAAGLGVATPRSTSLSLREQARSTGRDDRRGSAAWPRFRKPARTGRRLRGDDGPPRRDRRARGRAMFPGSAGRLDRPHDRRVHAVGDLTREVDRDVDESDSAKTVDILRS